MSAPMLACVDDYRAAAQAALPPELWRHLMLGDEQALQERGHGAAAAPKPMPRLMPRPLRRMQGGHTRLSLYGQEWAHPMALAPVAYLKLFHEAGEAACAMAASAQGAPMVISSLSSLPLEAVVQAAHDGGGPAPWFQLYWQGSREASLALVQRALQAGCAAVVFTVDAPIKLASLALPPGVAAVNAPGMQAMTEPDELALRQAGRSVVFDHWMALAPDWDDLGWLRSQIKVPLLIKGVLHPDDAEQAVSLGCDGVIVSSHGGRVLPGGVGSLQALPEVVQRIGQRVPVLLDSGVRSGRDVAWALSMGAQAVLIGRPFVWALASHGALGVAHLLRLLRDELEMNMALMGCLNLNDLGPGNLLP
jgi:4-hydroxymandelate oxidase